MVKQSKVSKEQKAPRQKHYTITENERHGSQYGRVSATSEWGWERTMKIVATSRSELEGITELDNLLREASLPGMPDSNSTNCASQDLQTLLMIHYAAQHPDQLEQMAHKEITQREAGGRPYCASKRASLHAARPS